MRTDDRTHPQADRQPALRRTRTFGEVVSDALTLLFARAAAFFPSLLALVAVPLMLAGLGEAQGENPEGLGVLLSLAGSIAGTVAGVLVTSATLVYALLIEEDPEAEITPSVLWHGAAELFWPVFAVQWVGGILVALGLLVVVLPAVLTGSVPVMVVAGIVALVAACYVFPAISLAVPIRVLEADGAIESIRRGFSLVKGQWKQTFAILFVVNFLAALVLLGPTFALGGLASVLTDGDTQSPVYAAAVMIAMVGYLAFALPAIASLLQYFNLIERREGPALAARVEEIGDDSDERSLF